MLHHQHFYLRRRGLGVIFTAVCAAVILLSAGLLSAPGPALAASATPRTYQTGAQHKLPEIVGSWLVTTTAAKQNVTFPALLTFTGDGIVLADEPPALYETTGHGAWTAAGIDGADFTFVSLVGSESGALSAVMKVAGSLVYDAAADTWQGTFTYRFTDAGGAEVAVDEGTMDAVRIGVEAPTAAAEASSAMLGPGAKVGEMVLSKGPDPFDLNIPPLYAFCNPNPQLVDGSKVGVPGVYTVECSLPPLPQLMIGFGWVTDTKDHLEEQWSNISTELYLNGKQVDQAAFGSLDATVPSSGLPGEDPDKVVETPLRTWNVMLENLQAGPLELRFLLNVAKDAADSVSTSPAGIYDVTYKITVDPALAAPEGEPAPVALVPTLGPGDKVGEMVLSQAPEPFDLNIPTFVAFCNGNPMLEEGSNVGKPGVYIVECSVPALPQFIIGFGWVTDSKEHLDEQWPAIGTELYLNGKQVDQAAFGSIDAALPVGAIPGEDADKVVELPMRAWKVMLENLQAGPLELHFIWNVAKDVSDSMTTTPAGIYDITYKITVDPALSAPEGEPAPVTFVPELITVFDGFNAAVNAHDVDKALSYFADDAVASFPNNLPEPTRFAGKDELRNWIETDAGHNIHVEVSGEKTSGDTVTATVTLTEDDLPPGFALEGSVEAVVQDGKIQSFTYTLSDATIEQLKALPQ